MLRWLVAEPALDFTSFDFSEGQCPMPYPLPARLAPGKHSVVLTVNEKRLLDNS